MQTQSSSTATMTDMEKRIKDYIAAWNSHDPDRVVSFFTDDAVFESMGTGKTTHGIQELKSMAVAQFTDVPDFKLETKSWFACNDKAAIEYSMSGTQSNNTMMPSIPVTNKKFSVPGITVLEFRGTKINSKKTYFNAMEVMRQIGAMPSMPGK